MMTRLVFLDTETTSLDDELGEVWEIGAIVRDVDGDSEWLWQIAPQRMCHADPNSLRVGGFYRRFDDQTRRQGGLIVKAPGRHPANPPEETTPRDVAATLARILDGAHVVGAVPDFDHRFLRSFLRKWKECWTAHYHLIDMETLAVGWLYGKAAALKQERPEVDWSWPLSEITALPWQSTGLYKALGVDSAQFEAHTALGDARLVRAVYDAITGGA